MNGVAEDYAPALNRPVSYVDVRWETWSQQRLPAGGLEPSPRSILPPWPAGSR